MPKKVDWEEIKSYYLESGKSMAALALKYGVSKRAIEKRASAEGWAALRKSASIIPSGAPTTADKSAVRLRPKTKTTKSLPRSQNHTRMHEGAFSGDPKISRSAPVTKRTNSGDIDEVEILSDAISQLSGSMHSAEVKSLEGAASTLAKLLELRRKLVPPSAVELAQHAIALGYTPDSFMQALAEAWREQA